MDNMKIVLPLDKYSIYAYDKYYLCFPNNTSRFYHLFIGFSSIDLRNLDEETLYKEIRKIGDSLNYAYSNAIYILPILDPKILNDAALENDDNLYNKLLKKYIQPITLEIHKNFESSNIYISHIVKFIKQNDDDKKFIGWLSMKLGDEFVREITFEDKVYEENPSYEPVISNDIATDYEIDDIWIKKQEEIISDTLKPAFSLGFSNLSFMLMVLTISLVFGIIIAYMIIK